MNFLPIGIGAVVVLVGLLGGTASMLLRKTEQLAGTQIAYDSLAETHKVQRRINESNEKLLAQRDKEKEKLRSETERLKRSITDEARSDEAVDNYLNTPIPDALFSLLREQESSKDNQRNPTVTTDAGLSNTDDTGPTE